MQEDMVKGCKAKCVERANEYKYKNLGPFFSQGENGPDNSLERSAQLKILAFSGFLLAFCLVPRTEARKGGSGHII